MGEIVPGVAVLAVVLTDRPPLPLAEVGSPFLPGDVRLARISDLISPGFQVFSSLCAAIQPRRRHEKRQQKDRADQDEAHGVRAGAVLRAHHGRGRNIALRRP